MRIRRLGLVTLAAGCASTAHRSEPPVALADGILWPSLVALDDTYVYFTSTGADVGGTGKISRVPKAGGPVEDLLTGLGVPYGIAVAGSDLYFTDHLAGTLNRLSLTSGTATVLASAQPHCNRVALDAKNIYWTNSGQTEDHDGSLVEMPLAGGSIITLATALADPEAIALDDTNVYWTNTTAGEPATVMRTRIDGTQATPTTLVTNADFPLGIALDEATLYWADSSGVMAVAKTSDGAQPPTTVVPNQDSVHELAVSVHELYWTTLDGFEKASTTASTSVTSGDKVASFYNGDGVALDATDVYYVVAGSLTMPGGVYRVAR